MGRAAIVVDPFLEKGCSAHDCLIQIADCLNIKRIDRHLLYKSHSQPPPCYVSQDLTKRAPLKAIATFLSDTPAVVATNKCLPDQQHKQKNNTLVVVLRHCEMVNIDVLNNLILLLRDPILPCYVSVLAFTDTLCSLPVQLSPAALAVVSVSTQTTASPWEIYDSLFGRLLNGRDIPVQFPPGLIENIHIAFKDSERCVTSAVHRYVV